jgi:aryl-alcohol dehydrogenase-like predicted oxidoreductase
MTTITADAAGTWKLGDLTVNRMGFGAMRLTSAAASGAGGPSDRDQAIRVLRRAVELGVNHIDTAAFYFSSLRSANELIFAIAGEGRGAGAREETDAAIRAVAAARGVSPAQIRLAWTLNQGPHVLAIPGTGNPAHLAENIAAGALQLTAEEMAALG